MIIDHQAKLEIADRKVDEFQHELQALQRLSVGLDYLNDMVLQLESKVAAKLDPEVSEICGNHPAFEGIPMDLVTCSFHWYSVTVCDYVRLVGWLGYAQDSKKALGYVKEVVPEVWLWRNKIGAHFVRSQPKRKDNIADQHLSVKNPLDYHSRAFHAGSAVLAIISNEVQAISHSQHSMMWSLTKTHRKLSPRYWPAGGNDKAI